MANSCTMGYLVFYVAGGELKTNGLVDSESSARASISILERIMPEHEWQWQRVPFLGWGFEGVFTNNAGEVVRQGALQ